VRPLAQPTGRSFGRPPATFASRRDCAFRSLGRALSRRAAREHSGCCHCGNLHVRLRQRGSAKPTKRLSLSLRSSICHSHWGQTVIRSIYLRLVPSQNTMTRSRGTSHGGRSDEARACLRHGKPLSIAMLTASAHAEHWQDGRRLR
jgi:hypothetical protein